MDDNTAKVLLAFIAGAGSFGAGFLGWLMVKKVRDGHNNHPDDKTNNKPKN